MKLVVKCPALKSGINKDFSSLNLVSSVQANKSKSQEHEHHGCEAWAAERRYQLSEYSIYPNERNSAKARAIIVWDAL
jgi:hypothetical protein